MNWSRLTFLVVVVMYGLVALVIAQGQPPKHCHYFVTVKGHAHIYSCSEYPRPVNP